MPTQQQQINYGAAANDGQGDPLRTAFIKTDDNFDAIWNAGPVGSNVTILNNIMSVVNANGNLAIAANGIGVIETRSSLVPRLANSYDLGAANLRYRSAYIGSGGLNVTGNLVVGGSYNISNLQVNTISSDDSSFVTVQDGLSVRGPIDTESIFTDNYYYANGVPFVPGSTYGNANVAGYLASGFGSGGSNTVFTLGNIVASAVDVANLQHNFPIGIKTNGGGTWQFAANIFRGPSGATWSSEPGVLDDYITSASNGFLNLQSFYLGTPASEINLQHDLVRLKVYNGPDEEWDFKGDGTLCTPGNICVKEANTHVIGNASNWWSAVYSQQFIGNTVSVSGLVQTGNIIPSANAVYSLGNSTNYWSNLWVANNTIYIGGVPLGISAGNVLTVNGESVTGNITFTDTTMSPPDEVDITISAANSEVIIEAFDIRLDATDDLRLTGNDIVSLRNRSTTDPVTIITDYDDTETTWTFAVDGTLTTPGDIVVAGDVTGTVGASTLVLKAQPASNTSIQLNNSVDSTVSIAANLDIVTDSSNTAQTWTFGTDGNLNYPDGTISTGGAVYAAANASVAMISNNEHNQVRVEDDYVEIFTSLNGITLKTWQFGNTGALTVPGNISFSGDPSAAPSLNDFFSVTSAVDFDIVANSAGTSRTFTFDAAGDLTVPGNVSATRLQNDGNVEIRSNVAGTLKNWTFDTLGDLNLPAGGNISGSGGISANNITLTGNISANTAGFAIGYRDIPQVAFTGNATIAAADAGKHFYSTESTDYILTIADNSAVSWPVGTAITVVNRGTGNITVAQASGVSLYLAGNSSAGNRTVSTYGMATVLNVAANVWMINGTGVA